MAQDINRATLMGHVGADPEFRTTQNGEKVCNFRMATSKRWKDRQTGETTEKTEWHSVTIFAEHLVKYAEAALRKGSHVYLEGELETRKWTDKDGAERVATGIVLRPYSGALNILDKRGGDASAAPMRDAGNARPARVADLSHDEIPF